MSYVTLFQCPLGRSGLSVCLFKYFRYRLGYGSYQRHGLCLLQHYHYVFNILHDGFICYLGYPVAVGKM